MTIAAVLVKLPPPQGVAMTNEGGQVAPTPHICEIRL